MPTALRSSSASAAGKTRDDHGHAQKLLLKEWYTERSLQNRFEQRMRIGNFFLTLSAAHIRMHHFADDGPGTNNGDLHDDIVETSRRIMRKGSHLSATLNLKHSHRIGFAECFVYEWIFGQGGQINLGAIVTSELTPASL